LKSADSSSLSETNWHASLLLKYARRCFHVEFEKPTSAPLIVPVVTITPFPLLYHVRTFYIARYTSSAIYPSQPIYTFNEFQKIQHIKKKQWNGKKPYQMPKKQNKNKTKHHIITVVMIIIIIIPIPNSITNIHIHNFRKE